MKRIAYLLVLLPIWHQIDDTWVVAAEFFAASQAGIEDNEEYLPSEQEQRAEECASYQKRRGVVSHPSPGDSPLARTHVLSTRRALAPRTPPSLYVFMSLQI
jgi:hypothetical protein